jgi:hypothetical protein
VSRARGRVREIRIARAIVDASVAVAWVTAEEATPDARSTSAFAATPDSRA